MSFAMSYPLDFLHRVQLVEHSAPVEPPCFFWLPSSQQLATVLHKPASLFLEMSTRDSLDNALAALQTATPHFGLSLLSKSAHHSEMAGIIADALFERFSMHKKCKMNILTCLQEALTNAVIHGNLSLHDAKESWENFEAYYQTVDQLLASKEYCHRRVNLAVWHHEALLKIAVTDEGEGFAIPAVDICNIPLPHHKSGRGLLIIQSLTEKTWVGKNRRTLFMNFKTN